MKIFKYCKLGLFFIGMIFLLAFLDFFINHLRFFIGTLMVIYGSLEIIELAIEKVKPIYNGNGFIFGLLELLIGLVVIIFISNDHSILVIWAMWSIFRETIEIKIIINGKLHSVLAIISSVESIVVILLSLLLLIEPNIEHAIIHSYLLCAELILAGSIPVLNEFMLDNKNSTPKD